MLERLFIDSPLTGTLIELGAVNDKIFSSGVDLLIFVGLNTCKLIGEGHSRAGFDTTTPVIVTNHENFGDIIFRLGEQKITARAPAVETVDAPHIKKFFAYVSRWFKCRITRTPPIRQDYGIWGYPP